MKSCKKTRERGGEERGKSETRTKEQDENSQIQKSPLGNQ